MKKERKRIFTNKNRILKRFQQRYLSCEIGYRLLQTSESSCSHYFVPISGGMPRNESNFKKASQKTNITFVLSMFVANVYTSKTPNQFDDLTSETIHFLKIPLLIAIQENNESEESQRSRSESCRVDHSKLVLKMCSMRETVQSKTESRGRASDCPHPDSIPRDWVTVACLRCSRSFHG